MLSVVYVPTFVHFTLEIPPTLEEQVSAIFCLSDIFLLLFRAHFSCANVRPLARCFFLPLKMFTAFSKLRNYGRLIEKLLRFEGI